MHLGISGPGEMINIHNDDNIDSEDDLVINIEDLVEQEVNKRRKQERDKEEMRLRNF